MLKKFYSIVISLLLLVSTNAFCSPKKDSIRVGMRVNHRLYGKGVVTCTVERKLYGLVTVNFGTFLERDLRYVRPKNLELVLLDPVEEELVEGESDGEEY